MPIVDKRQIGYNRGEVFREIKTTEEYGALISSMKGYHFAQSARWLGIKRETGANQRAFAYFRKDQPVLLGQTAEQIVLRNKICWLMTFGPIFNPKQIPTQNEINEFANELKNTAKQEQVVFVQINPFVFDKQGTESIGKTIRKCKTLKSSANPIRHTEGTISFDVSRPPQEALLQKFRDDVKYNLRRAIRDNKLDIKAGSSTEGFESFWTLYADAQKRLGFSDQRKSLYRLMAKNDYASVWLATAEKKSVSGVYTVKFDEEGTLITFLSATTSEGNKLRAPTLLRYRIFEWAHKNGYKKVDFFSVRKNKSGFTFFKMGFGGEVIWYPEPCVIVVDPVLYRLYTVYHSLFGKPR